MTFSISTWLGELVAPSRCAACDEEARLDGFLLFCEGCGATVERSTKHEAAFIYGGAMADAIVKLKYAGRSDLASRLGRAMCERAPRDVDVVVPVPLHPLRAAERGFNQSALLARPIARALDVSLEARALERIRDTPRQAALDRSDRLVNVRAAFRCRDPRVVEDKRILLIDDVRTTGATLSECRAVLAAAGARSVHTLVLAVRDELPEFR